MDRLADDSGRPRRGLLLAGALLLGLVGFAAIYHLLQRERIYPGVRVGTVDVGGLTPQQAEGRLADAVTVTRGDIRLRDPQTGQTWPVAAGDLGLTADPKALGAAAYDLGRTGANPVARLFHPLVFPLTHPGVPAAGRLDAPRARAALERLAPAVDAPPQNAGLTQAGGKLVALPARAGRQLDISGTLHALTLLAADPVTDTVDLAVQRTGARVPDLANVAEAYNVVVSGPLRLRWRDVAPFEVPLDTLKRWVELRDEPNPQGDRVPTLVFDRAAIGDWLEQHRVEIDRPAVNARFGFDETGQSTVTDRGRPALRLDREGSIDALINTAYTDVRVGELAVDEVPAAVTPAALSAMAGLSERARASTSLVGASPRRRKQLTAAAGRIKGSAVAPGGYFSFRDALGTPAEATGFDPVLTALPIPDGAVGQVCTTLLRTVWWSGLPILERHAPPVRQGWVEPPVGLDCSVTSAEDFRFLHDGAGYLLVDAVVDEARGLVTVVLYGQPDRRRVDTVGPRVTAVSAPGADRTVRSAGLASGEREQVLWRREGAEATVERTVRAGDRLVARDAWTSRYAPTGDVVLVGP